jgi:hypothetical protein
MKNDSEVRKSIASNMARKSVSENPIVVSTGAAAAVPARRKPSSAKRTARTVEAPEVVEAAAAPVAVELSREEIAALAYSYWETRGYTGGSPEEDWLRAEQDLRTRTR